MFVPTVVHAEEVSNQHVPITTVHCRARAVLSHTSLGSSCQRKEEGCLWKLLFLSLLPSSLPALKQINAGFNKCTLLVCVAGSSTPSKRPSIHGFCPPSLRSGIAQCHLEIPLTQTATN